MHVVRFGSSATVVAIFCGLAAAASPWGGGSSGDPVLRWNAVALQAGADDHSGTYSATPEHGGPTRGSRALAIVHVAIYDAANAIAGEPYEPYIPVGIDPATVTKASLNAAVAQAAHDTLATLYPSQKKVFDDELAKALGAVPAKKGRAEGVAVGAAAALNILMLRGEVGGYQDGSRHPLNTGAIPYVPTNAPGFHQPDPLNAGQGFLTPGWGLVDTFSDIDVTDSPYVLPPPPALDSVEYALSFQQVRDYGGDGVLTPTLRSDEETEIGLFWAYDGAKDLGVPPRLYNQMARALMKNRHDAPVDNARLFALINIAMADAGIACWENKYVYEFWRPIVGIRNADLDGNDDTDLDETWTPLGAPASNHSNGGLNFTPPFPAYPSGHATFGAAVCKVFERFYGTDDVSFTLRSDEMHPLTTDALGNRRPVAIRRFTSFSQASAENAASRIYLGVHWSFDSSEGMKLGQAVGGHVFDELLQPSGE